MKARRASAGMQGVSTNHKHLHCLLGLCHISSRTTSNQEFAMKKALYSLAVLMRFARADKLSATYIYY